MKIKMLSLSIALMLVGINVQAQTGTDSIKTVVIGTETWTQTNLNVSKFKNGEDVPEAKTQAEWTRAAKQLKPAWCYYDFDAKNGEKYGKLYNWYAVTDPRGLAPAGWHVPNDEEWLAMRTAIAVTYKTSEPGKFVKTKGWKGGNKATNESGFLAVPGGMADWGNGFHYDKVSAYFWTSSPKSPSNEVWHAVLFAISDQIKLDRMLDMGCGMSVRCVKDK